LDKLEAMDLMVTAARAPFKPWLQGPAARLQGPAAGGAYMACCENQRVLHATIVKRLSLSLSPSWGLGVGTGGPAQGNGPDHESRPLGPSTRRQGLRRRDVDNVNYAMS
jgi:hypothetical protein